MLASFQSVEASVNAVAKSPGMESVYLGAFVAAAESALDDLWRMDAANTPEPLQSHFLVPFDGVDDSVRFNLAELVEQYGDPALKENFGGYISKVLNHHEVFSRVQPGRIRRRLNPPSANQSPEERLGNAIALRDASVCSLGLMSEHTIEETLRIAKAYELLGMGELSVFTTLEAAELIAQRREFTTEVSRDPAAVCEMALKVATEFGSEHLQSLCGEAKQGYATGIGDVGFGAR